MKIEESQKVSHEAEEANMAADTQVTGSNTNAGSGKDGAIQLLAGSLLYMNTWGIAASYGVYQAYYSTRLIPEEPQSRIAWIGSMIVFLLLFSGVFIGPLLDAGYLHYILGLGTFLMCFGFMMTSLCDEFYQLFLAQGIVVGLAAGMLVLPAMTIPVSWYPSAGGRALVFSTVGTAASIGGIVYSVMFHYIQRDAGWRWAVRAIAFVTLAVNITGTALLRYREIPPQKRKFFVMSMWRERSFQLLVVAGTISIAVALTPLNWIEAYALSEQPTMSHELSFWLVAISMAAGIPGRIVLTGLSTKLGTVNVITFATAMCGVLDFAWMAVHSTGGIVVFAAFSGFLVLGWLAMIPLLVLFLAETQEDIHTRMGMAIGVSSFGVLAGLPLAGQILWSTGSYTGMQAFAGSLMLFSACVCLAIRYVKVGFKLFAKV